MNKEEFYIQEQRSSRDLVCGLSPDRFLLPCPQFSLYLPGLSTYFPLAFNVPEGQTLDCLCGLSVQIDPAVQCNKLASVKGCWLAETAHGILTDKS